MTVLLVIAVVLILFILVYFRIAKHFGITDLPNARSSHTTITIRGGGIIFPVAALLWFLFYGVGLPWLMAGLLLLAVVSFLDDVMTLSPGIRISVHLIAIALLFWQFDVFSLHWWLILFSFILAAGWLNAFNFMDGINGITPFYALTVLLTFLILNRRASFFPEELTVVMIISTVIFAFFNARKHARCFAGDVGSISMAYILGAMMAALILKSGQLEFLLFFSVYGTDTVFTILQRLWRRENIFKPHRSHLYQLLVNELGWPHLRVSGIYAFSQLIVNILVIYLVGEGRMTALTFFTVLILMSASYLILKLTVLRQIHKSGT